MGFEIEWQGSGKEECGIDRKSGRVIVRVNPRFYRPAEVDVLWGNPEKAQRELGWKRKISFLDLVTMMADSDERRVRNKRVFI